ncbi:MAG TPA: RNA methyltransferase [Candidatus Bathyarchaeia archaeon]|nr:RNA methyltransferase [Candidatus Bathyarchaeia archaeon]
MEKSLITSVQNPLVKRLCLLHERKGREDAGTFLVEGVHLVEEALRSGAHVVTLLYEAEKGMDPVCARALQQRADDVEVIPASAAVMAKLSETKTPQGIVAEVKKQSRDWSAALQDMQDRSFLLLLLDGIADPGNLGTILRTAEAAGADAVILGNGSVDLYNGKVVRATMGALFRLPVFTGSLTEVAEQIKARGGSLLVTSLGEATESYERVSYAGKIGIVIGNEARGVSEEMKQAATTLVHIPIYGGAESLNAAVASGIMLYEAQRQRRA